MRIDEFDYELPPERIAQRPAQRREDARLMVVDRRSGVVTHTRFADVGAFLPERARLFRNNARVLKARLHGRRATGGSVECLLLRPGADAGAFWCLLKPGRKLPVGEAFTLADGVRGMVADVGEDGERLVQFELGDYWSVVELAEAQGEMPLPPYIRREEADADRTMDEERYQTVFADAGRTVAAAAPTAGLHFSEALIGALAGNGVRFYDLTLHVGLGTFQPVKEETVEAHTMHREVYSIPQKTLQALLSPEDGPRIAVGTTSLRASEDALRQQGIREAGDVEWVAETGIYIYPPSSFAAVDGLITNFHLPRSTLLCLVAAFLSPGTKEGVSWLKELYGDAIGRGYRFFSYGDAMLIL